ncbi:MAG: 16S rRNA (adenine(1518)-N(6)/adenine(1519)-N(6))-dimethyltransferase RsmA [Bacteroidetes bacterium]|nr:16S rRNA (adenine(1518)-N(6)/adenine(1519)-N(6))-dimethyltransferase RsmA [Bacteroidota bacterium]
MKGEEHKVRPKKKLGQHFLHDQRIARNIVNGLTGYNGYKQVLEVGPGMGVLTQYLMADAIYSLQLVELDSESVTYLNAHYPALQGRVHHKDFLKADLNALMTGPFAIIGNFPYNISSQIFFKVLEYRQQIPEVVGMIQKEVAQRIAEPPGSKTYGILSVLLQAFYKVEYLFSVAPGVFTPPPKVQSAVLRLQRNERDQLPCNEKLFFAVVKQAFGTRRKTLRNALKSLNLPESMQQWPLLDKRAEQLSVEDFISITQALEN